MLFLFNNGNDQTMTLTESIPNPFEFGFSENAENSASLPASFFTDPTIFELEKEKIFFRSWLFAGHSTDIQNPGDYFITDIFGHSIFLIRDKDGAIRGYYNVCRHRGHELLKLDHNPHAARREFLKSLSYRPMNPSVWLRFARSYFSN